MQHDRKECWNLDVKSWLLLHCCGGVKGICLEAPKWIFTRPRNESTLTMLLVENFHRDYLSVRISLSEWMCWSVWCTECLQRNAVLYCSPGLGRWCGVYATSPSAKIWRVVQPWYMSRVWPLCRAHPKYVFLPDRDIGLRHLPPRMKNQCGSMRNKTFNRIKNDLSIECEWCISGAVSVDTNNQA